MHALVAIWIGMLASLGLLAYGIHAPEPQRNVPVQTEPAPVAPEPVTKPTLKAEKTYPVVKVVDGDTVVIKKDGENVTLRLIGMDAPETTTLRKGVVECFGKEATQRAEELLNGTSVSIETDASQGTYDKYERSLAYISLPDGRNFAEVMIVEGYAHEYTYNLPYAYQKEFRAAQKSAQVAKRGLWSDSACYGFRKPVHDGHTMSVIMPPASTSGSYECSKNMYNCSSFKTQAEAQAAFDACLPSEALAKEGGGNKNDVHKLDSDGDGKVCEGLP